jgi:lipoprotein-anchoring transpeptidase ErfK/SrfK
MSKLCSHTVYIFLLSILFFSCSNKNQKLTSKGFQYNVFKSSRSIENYDPTHDTANIFDVPMFIPGIDSFKNLIEELEFLWSMEERVINNQRIMGIVHSKKQPYTIQDKERLQENLKQIIFFKNSSNRLDTFCKRKQCMIYAEIVKSKQLLYLYVEGDLKDSFKVSTGINKYETPNLDVNPSGPLFIKYTSKKFPGGNYEGLGNMPYSIFIKGGYAIHGTTVGNLAFLGSRASHGCIRLHPNNAKILYELVNAFGLHNTWVRIID